ncbi:DNA polymerase I [Xylophilus phage Lumi]|nr:DNA polymerase I [Xylophilus phage Lumi]
MLVHFPPPPPGVTVIGSNAYGDIWSDGVRRTLQEEAKPLPTIPRLIDGNNKARRQFEANPGTALRTLFDEAYWCPAPQIWVFDGTNSKAVRRKIYPDYKANRPPATDGFYRTLDFFKELLMHAPVIMIQVPEVEADDVIATMAKTSEDPVEIHSNDGDYNALESDLVKVIGTTKDGTDPTEVRLMKTLWKDGSDNLKGIHNFGEKAWLSMTPEFKADMLAWILEQGEFPAHHFTTKLCKPVHAEWCQQNAALLRAYWKVAGFIDVPQDIISKHMTFGKANAKIADAKLKDLFL